MEQRRAVRINLATPFRGSRLAGTALPMRADESVRRFVGGFVTGMTLAAAIGLIAAALGMLVPAPSDRAGWTFVSEQELAVVGGEIGTQLGAAVRLGAELRALESIPARRDLLSALFGIGRVVTPAEERAARLLAMDVRKRLEGELHGWDDRAAEIAAEPRRARTAAIRVLSLLRWQVNGGEFVRALRISEEIVGRALAAAAVAASEAAKEPPPTAARRRSDVEPRLRTSLEQ